MVVSMPSSLAGKSVLVTGAGRGIGAATGRELARRGARVAFVGLEPELLAHHVADLGPGHVWAEADVTDQTTLDAAVATTVESFGGIDVVIANAGIANFGTVRTASPADFARTVDVNLTGVYRTVYAAVPALVQSKGYALVVASLASFTPMPGGAAYAASKAGVESLTGSLRAELAGYGVVVGSAHPSWIDTDLVRDGEQTMPTFKRMRAAMPWPASSTTPVQVCATALADAVERRALRVYVPRSGVVFSVIRPVLHSSPVQLVLARRVARDLRQLDVENQQRGASWH
jgi:NAD(P)-dependent dehydrogenase (short-subunit alcohol dehydrogenase family)